MCESCNAPICPRELVEGMVWWGDEPVCGKREYKGHEIVVGQRERIGNSSGYVVVEKQGKLSLTSLGR